MANTIKEKAAAAGNKVKTFVGSHKKAAAAAAVVALACAAALLAFALKGEKAEIVYEEVPVLVSVHEVTLTGQDTFLTYAGIVQPGVIEQCTPTSVATVKEVLVSEGDTVVKDQLLVRLDSDDAETRVDSAKNVMDSAASARDNAASSLNRAKDNYNKVSAPASKEDIAKAKADLADSEARRDAKQAEYDKADADYKADAQYEQSVRAKSDAVAAYEQAKADYESAPETTDDEKIVKYGVGDDGTPRDAATCTADSLCGRYHAARDAAITVCGVADEAGIPSSESLRAELQSAQSMASSALAKRSTIDTELATLNTEVEADKAELARLEEKGTGSGDAEAAKAALETAQTTYDDADLAYENAKASYEQAKSMLDDYEIRAGHDGKVITVVATEGSTATPIAPVVVIGTHDSVVSFGVSQGDVRSIAVGDAAEIIVSGRSFAGEVKSIGMMPDEQSRTYDVEVSIKTDDAMFLGETATVRINVGDRKGAWLPLAMVLNDGEDYVFVVVGDRVQRRNITISALSNDYVLVEGLKSGELVVDSGLSLVRAGSLVEIAG